MSKEQHGHRSGGKTTPTYSSWNNMIGRCVHKSCPRYEQYGGRGITVCKRWRDSFVTFLEDMGLRPEGTSIDRIDNDGNYEPENCRWITNKEQQRNRSNNYYLTHKGQTLCVSEWAEILGVRVGALFWRISKGWSTQEVLDTPIKGRVYV